MAVVPFSTTVKADSMVVSGGGTYGIGDTVVITVQFYGDFEIYAYDGYLTYDETVLSGECIFAEGGDGSNYACASIDLTVVGYGDTYVSVSGSYSDGIDEYSLSDYTYVSVPTPAPEEPQTGEVVTDEPAEDYNGNQWTEAQEHEEEAAVTAVTESETTTPVDENKLKANVNGSSMLVVNSFTTTENVDEKNVQVANPVLANLPVLNGFNLAKTSYNGETVDIYQIQNVIDVYVLTDENKANADYYTYDQESKSFKKLIYGTYNSRLFVILDIPEDVSLNNYEKKELKINNGSVVAFQAKTEANENESSLANASPKDFYIVYAIADGSAGYYSYDQKDITIQRLNSGFVDGLVKEEVTTKETKADSQLLSADNGDDSFGSLPKGFKLLILLLIAIIIAMAITMIVFFTRKKSYKSSRKEESVPREMDDLFILDDDYSPMDIDYNGLEPTVNLKNKTPDVDKDKIQNDNTEEK